MARRRGPAAELHARRIDWSRRSVTFCEVGAAAVVLGSTQPASSLRADLELPVVRRASGGGAVLVEPGGLVWADVVVPAGDPLWHDDVGRAAWWVGDAWAGALAVAGVADVDVHRGGLVRTAWSSAVCFAGLGPGEVRAGGRKVVGLAQRRTRHGALFQCAALLRWDAGAMAGVLALDAARREEVERHLAGCAAAAGVAADRLEEALIGALPGGGAGEGDEGGRGVDPW